MIEVGTPFGVVGRFSSSRREKGTGAVFAVAGFLRNAD